MMNDSRRNDVKSGKGEKNGLLGEEKKRGGVGG